MNRHLAACLAILVLSACPVPAAAADGSAELFAGLPPGEQYRQLSLMLLMAGGVPSELLDRLETYRDGESAGAGPVSVDPDDYRTPLVRIVDQDSLLRGAGEVIAYVNEHRNAVRERQAAIEADYPVLIGMVDRNALMEDAIIIRNAIADSMVYTDFGETQRTPELVDAYHRHTVYLRNELEFARFNDELVRITDEAIGSVGGRMDAYQRMFDDELESDSFARHIEAAEFIYERRGEFDPRAGELTEELIENLVMETSRVDN